MKKIILASVSSIALLGLAACSDTDTTTTESIQTETVAPEADDTTTQSIQGESDADVIIVPDDDAAATDVPTDDTTTQSIDPDANAEEGEQAPAAQ